MSMAMDAPLLFYLLNGNDACSIIKRLIDLLCTLKAMCVKRVDIEKCFLVGLCKKTFFSNVVVVDDDDDDSRFHLAICSYKNLKDASSVFDVVDTCICAQFSMQLNILYSQIKSIDFNVADEDDDDDDKKKEKILIYILDYCMSMANLN